MASVSAVDMARRIREGTLKRREEERKKLQLEQEYLDVVSEKLNDEHQQKSSTRFLPSILIFLTFVSFPLSDQVVDWYLVAIFCALNAVLVAAFTNPSDWVSIGTTVLINFFLVRFSAEVYDVPERLMQVPLVLLANYVAVNALIVAAAYLLYVNPQLLHFGHRYQPPQRRAASSKRKATSAVDDTEMLEEFAQEKAKAERLDLFLCLLLLLNFGALIFLDVIPFEAVWQSGVNVFRLLQ